MVHDLRSDNPNGVKPHIYDKNEFFGKWLTANYNNWSMISMSGNEANVYVPSRKKEGLTVAEIKYDEDFDFEFGDVFEDVEEWEELFSNPMNDVCGRR